MTSYANDVNEPTSSAVTTTTQTPMRTATTTTTSTTATSPTLDNSQIVDVENDDAVALAKQTQSTQNQQPTTLHLLQHHHQQHQQQQSARYGLEPSEVVDDDDELDEYEEREEKADTTPENLKKIDDDLIELEMERERTKQQQQQHHHHQPATPATPTTPASEALALGLAVAIDESNVKFCFMKKPSANSTSGSSSPHSPRTPTRLAASASGLETNQATSSTATTTTAASPPADNNKTISLLNCNQKAADFSSYKTAELLPTTPSSTSSSPSKLLQSPEIANYSIIEDSSTNSNITTTAPTSDNSNKIGAKIETTAASDAADSGKRACAFTFTFDNDDTNAAATAARYKSVMERFQNRHRRGASMSKLDNGADAAGGHNANMSNSLTGDSLSLSSSASASPLTLRNTAAKAEAEAATAKVKLRPRDRSTSRVRDAAKRHSWSPRSSTNELSLAPPMPTTPQQQQQSTKTNDVATRPPIASATRRSNMSAAVTKIKQPPPPPLVLSSKPNAQLIVANRAQQFTPRSTALQMALSKIDMLLPQAPLGDYVRGSGSKPGNVADDDVEEDDVSEAGTYTLDGDNYTEEQKDLMNIDKSLKRRQQRHAHHHAHQRQQHQQQLKERLPMSPRSPTSPLSLKTPPDLAGATKIPIRTSNVLEVNYFHNEEDEEEGLQQQQHQQQQHTDQDDYYSRGNSNKSAAAELILGSNSQHSGAYLGNIRSKVLRNLLSGAHKSPAPQTPPQQESEEEKADVGCFTSVTTSGVLAKQSALDPRPAKLNRKHSLTTSQIDSSEYISNEVKLKNAPAAMAALGGGYTDHQKAEYRLNLFTNQKERQKYAATRHLIETPPETPQATTEDKLPSDTAALALAQNKNDWIQQWARNARARSEAANSVVGRQQQHKNNMMTRSYNCGSTSASAADVGSLTDDSLYLSQQQQQQLLHYRDNEFDYSSDPSAFMSTSHSTIIKPPKSPSKIPSPLHSIGRARSASRTRGSLQGLLAAQEDELNEENIYLAKTAAAINNLQQSISRKNSLKSPTGSMSSPRRRRNPTADNSADDSPLHSIESDGYRHPPPHARHRRNLSNEGGGGGVGNGGGYAVTAATAAVQAATQAQLMTSSFNEQQLQLLTSGEYLIKQMRMRKNSFDGNICSPRRRGVERAPELQQQQQQQQQPKQISPLHRAGSFSMKANAAQPQRAARPQYQNIYTPPAARQAYAHSSLAQQQQQAAALLSIKKSASSNNFVQHYDDDYDENLAYYINDADDGVVDDDELLDVEDDDEGELYEDYNDEYVGSVGGSDEYGPRTITLHAAPVHDAQGVPLTSTRYNKALLMRIERSKQRVAAATAANKPNSAPLTNSKGNTSVPGLMACPNTPELPRRNVKSAPRAGAGGAARQSMPRDVSLSRLASQVPNSLASAKRQLLQTAAAGVPAAARGGASGGGGGGGQRVQPKYLDISKYKPAQGNAFLRKNESKSTLKTPTYADSGIKRSPSSSGLSRNDPTRASNRSVRSMMTTSCTGAIGGGSGSANSGNISRASSAVRRDDSVSKQKEIEMAMWKRRSTYDPLKAAAEDRRRKEEAKRLASMAKEAGDVLCESPTAEEQQ